jgi:hypothetical protein
MSVSIESNNLNRTLLRMRSSFAVTLERQEELTRKLSGWEFECFIVGNEQCVEDTDRLFLKQQQLKREQGVAERQYHRTCVQALPPYLQSLDFVKGSSTMKDIRFGEAFIRCYEKHLLAMTKLIYEENRLLFWGLKEMNKQYNKN